MLNEDTYISLRNSLDSMRDVALADYALIETVEGRKHFSDWVAQTVKNFLIENKTKRQSDWQKLHDSRAKDYTAHAEELLANKPSLCPPGFREENGLCVPI